MLNARNHASKRLTAAMRREVEPHLEAAYASARRVAILALWEHGEVGSAELLPKKCPYTFDQLLDDDWFPANQHGLVDPIT